jgi:hypothetical protein
MGTEMIPEMMVFNKLAWQIAQEHFINVSRCESITSYNSIMPLTCIHTLLVYEVLI